MATDRKLLVTIIGDDKSLQRTLSRSAASVSKFGKDVDRSLRRGVSTSAAFEPMLARTREMQGETKKLSESLDATGVAAGRAGTSMLGLIGRGTLVGLALNAAYQGSQRLQESLTKTGEEAFTTGGRLSNMGASLLSGDLLGAFQALSRQPKTLEDLGISAVEAGNRLDALGVVARGVDAEIAKVGDRHEGIESYRQAAEEAGTKSEDLARQLINLVAAQQAAENSASSLADAAARLGTVFVTTTGQAVTFKGAVDDLGGLRGPGAVDAINAAIEAAAGSTSGRIARPIGPTAKNAAAQMIAAANDNLQELLRLQKVERDRLAEALANSTGNVKQREALRLQLAAAQAAVINTEKAIAGDAAARARATEAARKAAATAAASAKKAAAAEAKAAREEAARLAALVEQRRKAAIQARQFRSLGLAGTGEEIVPGIQNLQTRIAGALRRIDSGQLDVSSKMVGRLKLARAAIRKEGKNLTEDTRRAINELIQTVTQGQNKLDKVSGPITKTTSLNANKVLKGMGLSPEEIRELRARLSSFNTAGLSLTGGNRPTGQFRGGVPVVENHNTISIDGEVVGRSVTKSQQKRKRRNPTQKRGPNGGV